MGTWNVSLDEDLIQQGAAIVGPDGLLIYLFIRSCIRRRPRNEGEKVMLEAGIRFVFLDYRTIARRLKLSMSTVIRRLHDLREKGWIRVYKRAGWPNLYVLGDRERWFSVTRVAEADSTIVRMFVSQADGEALVARISNPGPGDTIDPEESLTISEDCENPPVSGEYGEDPGKKRDHPPSGSGSNGEVPVKRIRRILRTPAVIVPTTVPENSSSPPDGRDLDRHQRRDLEGALFKSSANRNSELTVDEIVAAWKYKWWKRFRAEDPRLKRKVDRDRAATAYRAFTRAVGEEHWNAVRGFLFDRFDGWADDFEANKAKSAPDWFRILELDRGAPPKAWSAALIRGR